ENTRQEEIDIRGLKVSGIEEMTGAAKFDLTLTLAEARGSISGGLVYSQDLYEGETIRRMARHYVNVLEEVVRDAEQKIRQIVFLGEAEKIQIIEEWNETNREYRRGSCLHELVEEEAERRPDAVAVIHGEKQLSYGELNSRANRLARYL